MSLEKSLDRIGMPEKAQNVGMCARWIEYRALNGNHDNKQLHRAMFCKHPLCPVCTLRKSRQKQKELRRVIRECQRRGRQDGLDYVPIMLTLTVPRCAGDKLRETMRDFMASWQRFLDRRKLKRVMVGWFRALEITYDGQPYITRDMWYGEKNKKRKPRAKYYQSLGLNIGDVNPNYDTYHPHLHVIILVDSRYFWSADYTKQAEWCEMWAAASGVDNPIVDVRRMGRGKGGIEKAVKEIAKYTTKDDEIFGRWADAQTDRIVCAMDAALTRRRRYDYGGLMAKIQKILKISAPEPDAKNVKPEPAKPEPNIEFLLYKFGRYGERMDYRLHSISRASQLDGLTDAQYAPEGVTAGGSRRAAEVVTADARRTEAKKAWYKTQMQKPDFDAVRVLRGVPDADKVILSQLIVAQKIKNKQNTNKRPIFDIPQEKYEQCVM
jgi:plasmid rolling circle replication initiator protein Rep